jgi:signal transduction histidine kinase
MFRQYFNWRSLLGLVAILIVSGTILYSSYLGKKIERDERKKVSEWVEASNSILNAQNTDTRLAFQIIQGNDDIPIIATTGQDSIIGYKNLDSAKAEEKNSNYLKEKLEQFKSQNRPITYYDPIDPTRFNRYYFGHSRLQQEVMYYPYVELFVLGLFILITIFSIRSSYRSVQNQVWAGMAKETAHQLGTPVSALEGWIEILKEKYAHEIFVNEIEKDVSRLRLVSDRFGKIGSAPQLEERNIIIQVQQVMEYIKKRAGGKVTFSINDHGNKQIYLNISAPLFDWVIENLLKNALDAMEGKGSIVIDIQQQETEVIIDITDSGKGISKHNLNKVFKPGFTTKKRGWGLGLSLSKRIIEQYHKGTLTVKQSELGRGTTFRIILGK